MIEAEQFDLIRYRAFEAGERPQIESMIGLDTEALENGKPFMCCLSTGDEFDLDSFPFCFFTELPDDELKKQAFKKVVDNSVYLNKHYCTYNLKYDSGGLLYNLSNEEKTELWKYGIATIKRDNRKFQLSYIPHKYLSITYRKAWVKIWDVAQYFKMPLSQASLTYLGKKGKLDIETKTFTDEYVRKNRKRIKEYCIVDAKTCSELGNYLLSKLQEFGIKTTSLYSPASLSYEYFSSRTQISTVERLWKRFRDVLLYSVAAYKGGKFEVTARGRFEQAWQYDIVSAYPYQIRNLMDVDGARIVYSRDYIPEAQYAFLRVHIVNHDFHLPCALKNSTGVDIYPVGDFYTTVTKAEYDYMKEIGVKIDIVSAYWLVIEEPVYPYRDIIDQLFKIKSDYKGKDLFLYNVSKLMMNSYYGKTLQLVPQYVEDKANIIEERVDKRGVKYSVFGEKIVYKASNAFNPIHGAIITANTRIQITKIQNLMGKDCMGVHTDSALCLSPLPPNLCGGGLGELELQKEGEGIMLACGQYQIGSKGAYKGFKPMEGDDWEKILEENRNKSKIPQETLHVEGWYECVAKGHWDKVNLFQKATKIVDLNADSKRIWMREVKGRDLLAGVEHSLPPVVIHSGKPKGWKIE